MTVRGSRRSDFVPESLAALKKLLKLSVFSQTLEQHTQIQVRAKISLFTEFCSLLTAASSAPPGPGPRPSPEHFAPTLPCSHAALRTRPGRSQCRWARERMAF